MVDALLHVKDRTGERTLKLPEEAVLAVLAATRDSTDSLEELLKEAAQYDARVSPRTAVDAREDNDRPGAPFRVDLVERVIAFPADRIRFPRRGVLRRREQGGGAGSEHLTYELGREFRLVDSGGNRALDEKTSLRSEKAVWADVLPLDPDAAGEFRVDGTDFGADAIRDLRVWTITADDRAPTVNGKSVYEINIEGPRHATVMGQTHDEGTRHRGSGKPGG